MVARVLCVLYKAGYDSASGRERWRRRTSVMAMVVAATCVTPWGTCIGSRSYLDALSHLDGAGITVSTINSN